MDVRIRRFEKERKLIPTIQINETYENMYITPSMTLTLPSNYPFVPPLLKIHNIEYIKYLERGFKMFKPFIDHYKINTQYNCCLCCSSITGDNWTPTYGIKIIIEEYKKYYAVLQKISIAKLVLQNIPMDDLIHSTILSYLL